MPNVAHIAAAAALLFAVAPMPAFAAETMTGSYLAACFSNGHGSREESTLDIDSKAFGLTPEQFAGTNGTVTLALERESGSFDGTGTIANGTGGGTFTFTPSEAFRAAMHDRGYDLTDEDCLRAAMLGLTTSYIDGIAKLGFHHLELHELWAFRALGVDETFIHTMQTTFPKNALAAHELVSLRALEITGPYVTSMRGSGFDVDEPEDAVKLRALGIDGKYVERVRSHGFAHPTIEQLVKLKALNIVDASWTPVLV